jgi:hypothetical protein
MSTEKKLTKHWRVLLFSCNHECTACILGVGHPEDGEKSERNMQV